MHKLLLLFLLAPSIFANPLTQPLIPAGSCGINKYNVTGGAKPELYIVGGKTAKSHFYPWQVSLQMFGEHSCGGTIISERHILTAAHCFEDLVTKYWTVMVGKHNLFISEDGQQAFRVAKIARHEKYNSVTSANDLTLLTLTKNITFNDDIQPACLPDKEATGDLVGSAATITGWGSTFEGGDIANTLREVQIPIITNAKCQRKYPEEEIVDSMMCAGYDAGGKDSCQGDSGGPMVLQKDGRYEVVGVVSWGYGCANRNRPGVYTRVSHFLDWIHSKMASSNE